jgi:hypothetical protein
LFGKGEYVQAEDNTELTSRNAGSATREAFFDYQCSPTGTAVSRPRTVLSVLGHSRFSGVARFTGTRGTMVLISEVVILGWNMGDEQAPLLADQAPPLDGMRSKLRNPPCG